MAKKNSTQYKPYAPGVKVKDGFGGTLDYLGTAESLAAAGMIDVALLPGSPGQRKSFTTGDYNGKYYYATNLYNGKFRVTIGEIKPYDAAQGDGDLPGPKESEWKHYARGVEVRSAETADDDRCYRGWSQYLLDAGVIGEDLLLGGYAIYGDKRVNAEVIEEDWLLVHERLVDFERLPELSAAENEMVGMFRRCCHAGRIHLIRLARSFAELNKNIGDGNVIDFAAYRRERGYAEAR